MAKSKGSRDDEPLDVRPIVIQASKSAVGLLRAHMDGSKSLWDDSLKLFIDELSRQQLTTIVAVQNVWMLEQMEYIAHRDPEMTVEAQVQELGLIVAQQDAFG